MQKNKLKAMIIEPGTKVDLSKYDANDDLGWTKEDAAVATEKNRAEMAEMHDLLWAASTDALLIVLQGMDTAGKDGTVRHVMTGLNPQGCNVTSFKVPTAIEANHDYLWRIHRVVPSRGTIGVFNRSHYEDVLVTRVRKLISDDVAKRRFEQINWFENYLIENHVHVLKIFLHISRDEQRERLESRLVEKSKSWKLSESDLEARAHWDDYQHYYEEALAACSTKHAPWYIVPANRKWLRNLVVSQLITDIMSGFNMKWPKPEVDLAKVKIPK